MNGSSSSQGSAVLTVLIDNQSQLEFDRNKALPDNQLAYLDRMDVQMDAGVWLDDGFSVDLVFDEPYATETIVEFVPRPVS